MTNFVQTNGKRIKTLNSLLPKEFIVTEKKCFKCGNFLFWNKTTEQDVKCCFEYALGKNEILKQIHSKENEMTKLVNEINILKRKLNETY